MQNFSNLKWVFPWSFIVHVFGSILRFFLRFFSENFVEKGSILDDFCDGKSIENDNEEMDCDQIEEKEVETVYYTSNTSKYLSSSGNSVCAFIEEPQNMHFRVQEIFMISQNNSSPKKDDTSFEVISGQCSVDFDNNSFNHDLRVDFCSLEHNDCHEFSEEMGVKQNETDFSDFGLSLEEQDEKIDQKDEIIEKKEFCDEVHSSISNSDDFWAIIHEYDCFLDKNDELDSCFDEILDETNYDEAMEFEKVNYDQDNPKSIEDSRNNVEENLTKDEISNLDIDKESVLEDSNNGEEDDQIKTSDIIMAQRELIRQMKKEIRQLKVCGLPTILEELESPRMEEDLRPLKIDKRMGHKDRMQEIHTFYRMYLDKMKKLDILSHQTMYAIELLQLKYQKMTSNKKVKIPVMKSFVAQNFWFNKLRKHESEPVEKLIRDLERELELAYVGQLCLSWEMLKWQYYKAEELQVHDPDGFYQHNQVAGEFQKFQVLLQRFTEDEPFQHASRVPHYVKTRSDLPAFLQVPLIKGHSPTSFRHRIAYGDSLHSSKEGEKAEGPSKSWELLSAKVPETTRSKTKSRDDRCTG
ncbi:uncharacterized protein LOC130821237 isoform X2 [Amaranthus tricolor]|uniref:uncharacterized protein LOC130821237 isoform X2 n=1 Tax=Amaranthus tricolor TaxID=29722 RepID=UPI0025908AB5|nr:uncharacterized protein LOC130821237 isoform X2 [Amaranthus tricolor]